MVLCENTLAHIVNRSKKNQYLSNVLDEYKSEINETIVQLEKKKLALSDLVNYLDKLCEEDKRLTRLEYNRILDTKNNYDNIIRILLSV